MWGSRPSANRSSWEQGNSSPRHMPGTKPCGGTGVMTTVADATSQQRNDALSPAARRAIFGAWLGFFVDQFDIYLPGIALAPAATYFPPKTIPTALAATIY